LLLGPGYDAFFQNYRDHGKHISSVSMVLDVRPKAQICLPTWVSRNGPQTTGAHMGDRVDLARMGGEKLVAEASPSKAPRTQASARYRPQVSRVGKLRGFGNRRQFVEPGSGTATSPTFGSMVQTTIIAAWPPPSRSVRIEQRSTADIGQADDTAI